MAKVMVTGIRKVDFEDDQGKVVRGTSLYYKKNLEMDDRGNYATGYMTDKVWLRDGTDIERKMLGASYVKPFEVDLRYDIIPGSRRPTLVDIVF